MFSGSSINENIIWFSGSVPAYYRDVYNLISSSSSLIQTRKESLKDVLAKSKLPAQTLCKVRIIIIIGSYTPEYSVCSYPFQMVQNCARKHCTLFFVGVTL